MVGKEDRIKGRKKKYPREKGQICIFIKIKNGCLLISCNSGKAKATPGFWYNSSDHWPSMVAFHGHQQSYSLLRCLTQTVIFQWKQRRPWTPLLVSCKMHKDCGTVQLFASLDECSHTLLVHCYTEFWWCSHLHSPNMLGFTLSSSWHFDSLPLGQRPVHRTLDNQNLHWCV